MPESKLPAEPTGDELIARFAWLSEHFDEDGDPTWNLFLPVRNHDIPSAPLETSVQRIDGLETDIWLFGVERVRPVITGRADLRVATVLGEGLAIAPDPPPQRHAAIRGWEEGKAKLVRQRRKATAARLALLSTPHLRPINTDGVALE